MDWSTAGSSHAALFWNPAAISYLSELLLAVVLAAYLLYRAFQESTKGRFHAPTWMLAILMLATIPGFLSSMFRVLIAGGWLSYTMPWAPLDALTTLAMPWARPFGAIMATALILLAYLFPRPLPRAWREMRIVAVVLGALILIEAAIAVKADLAILAREAWWRPQWLAGWMNIATLWTAIVFWRQLVAAHGQPLVQPHGSSRFTAGLAPIWSPAPNREARVARAFLFFTILPIIHTIALLLPDESQLARFPLDILICWLVLLQLVGLTLVLVGYLPERTTFLFKLTVIGLAILLAAINGAAWVVSSPYQAQFRASGIPASGDALLFAPRGGDLGYAVQPAAFLPERIRGPVMPAGGAWVDLPFDFPFYGRSYDRVYIDGLGTIAFDRMPRPVDAAFEQGVQPAIYPMLVDRPENGTRITAFTDSERLIVTRRDTCDATQPDRCYRIQTILHADGRIDIAFLEVPPAPPFLMLSPLNAPWLVGITPGHDTSAGEAVLQDHYRAFMLHLDRLFSPFVLFILVVTMATLIGLPLMFRTLLLGPLERLLSGMRRYRDGEVDTQVQTAFSDEIGYLIESFNALAREQTAMVRELEKRVADRVSEIADMTIRSTKLEERARLSADLHDAVAQTLASASLHASALPARLGNMAPPQVKAAEQVARLNRHALNEMRLLLIELRDDGEHRSLNERLGELVQSFSELHSLAIDFQPTDPFPLPAEVSAMFYRVAQESLNNVVKHSGTREVEMTFDAAEDRAMLTVSDHGRGFDQAQVDRHESLGLSIMRDRAQMIDATLEIDSAPEQGCRVTMIWIR
ncbi:sensor histidine kinase [Alteriqipengyuania sp.]|uniref:sensor histidine kinase n=1 Tax=Alteriqipengyuania sp. TaxID=2800692 RepID=UPI00351396FF